MKVGTIGLDPAKSVFQVHGIDDAGQIVLRRVCDEELWTKLTLRMIGLSNSLLKL